MGKNEKENDENLVQILKKLKIVNLFCLWTLSLGHLYQRSKSTRVGIKVPLDAGSLPSLSPMFDQGEEPILVHFCFDLEFLVFLPFCQLPAN